MSTKFHLAETKHADYDSKIDTYIQECLKINTGRCFITFAGAGSGKTYSLKKASEYLTALYSKEFTQLGKKVAIITYTNNAANEIKDRIEINNIFSISTIHSFCWAAISGFNEDIRKWYLETIPKDIDELEQRQRKGKKSKASEARAKTIIRLQKKMQWLAYPRTFIYDPNGVNSLQNALTHSEVLEIFSYFLTNKPLMVEIISCKYPFIFIDESQDTDKGVVNAFFKLVNSNSNKVVIGLFGDTMQRIFGGGEPELGRSKPINWSTFVKEMNHRSAKRIIALGNKIRSENDNWVQFAPESTVDGYVRYFLIPYGVKEKENIEKNIREKMSEITGDISWKDAQSQETAILLLEHRMASYRLGFNDLWDKLVKSDKIKNRISDGSNTELNFFSNIILPLSIACINNNQAELLSILRKNNSPLLEPNVFSNNKYDPLKSARIASGVFKEVISKNNTSFRKILEVLMRYNLLSIPEKLQPFALSDNNYNAITLEDNTPELGSAENELQDNSEIAAWAEALETNFSQIKNYKKYIDEESIYRTHQGVKGNEFERVMVVMDDDEAGGFLFSYEQYFGVKDISPSSQKRQQSGEETGIDRTRRLFYVTSTRAKRSLAHVIYTSDVNKLKKNIITRGFALDNEVTIINHE